MAAAAVSAGKENHLERGESLWAGTQFCQVGWAGQKTGERAGGQKRGLQEASCQLRQCGRRPTGAPWPCPARDRCAGQPRRQRVAGAEPCRQPGVGAVAGQLGAGAVPRPAARSRRRGAGCMLQGRCQAAQRAADARGESAGEQRRLLRGAEPARGSSKGAWLTHTLVLM